MQHVQVPLIDVGGQEKVKRLALADVRRAVTGEFHDPALVNFKRRFVGVFFILRQEIQVQPSVRFAVVDAADLARRFVHGSKPIRASSCRHVSSWLCRSIFTGQTSVQLPHRLHA